MSTAGGGCQNGTSALLDCRSPFVELLPLRRTTLLGTGYVHLYGQSWLIQLSSLPPSLSLSIRLLSGSVFDDGDDVDSFEDKVIIPTAQCVSECVRWLSMLCQDMYTVID